MNSKQRKLEYIRFKNKLTRLCSGKVNLDRHFKFVGIIGHTKEGQVVIQNKILVVIYNTPETSPKIDMSKMFPEENRIETIKSSGSSLIFSMKISEPVVINKIELGGVIE